jgi:hypothetical protein
MRICSTASGRRRCRLPVGPAVASCVESSVWVDRHGMPHARLFSQVICSRKVIVANRY